MRKNKIIICVLIIIIIALLIGIFLTMPNFSKTDSTIQITSNTVLKEGDNLQIKLTDINGTVLANQSVKITFTDKNNTTSDYYVVTNSEGVGQLKLDKDPGEYNVTVIYSGNDTYNGFNTTFKLTIEEKVVQTQTSSSNNDPGAFYSPQAGRVIHTGEIANSPGGLYRHLGYNNWVPVK